MSISPQAIAAAVAAMTKKGATVAPAQTAAQKQAALVAQYQPMVQADLQSGNYLQAFQDAAKANVGVNQSTVNTNPLMIDLETQKGLSTLAPGKTWSQADLNNYYSASMDPSVRNINTYGRNPYGSTLWGDASASKATQDAATDFQTNKGAPPDIARFSGKQPDVSFAKKWGVPIAMLATAALAGPAVGALAGTLGGGVGATVGAGALYGAGTGAATAAIGGGNVGKSALLGGLGGGITSGLGASGLTSGAEKTLTGAGLPAFAANGITQGAIGAGVGALKGAVGGTNIGDAALRGGVGGAITGGVDSALGISGNSLPGVLTGVGSGILTNALIGKYTGNAIPGYKAPTAATPQALPTLPGAQAQSTPPATAGNTTGLGYAPRQEADTSGINFSTYGQGPEQQFFKPA